MKTRKDQSTLLLLQNQQNPSLFSLQSNLLNVWTQKKVDKYYQKAMLAYMDNMNQQNARQQLMRQHQRMLQNKSHFSRIKQYMNYRQQLLNILQNRLNNQRQLQQTCKNLDELRKINLKLCQCIFQIKQILQSKGLNGNVIYQGYSQLFKNLHTDNKNITNSYLKNYIHFGQGYDPFFLVPYQIIQKRTSHSNLPKCIQKLFRMNISYVYRLIKMKHQLIKSMCFISKQFQSQQNNLIYSYQLKNFNYPIESEFQDDQIRNHQLSHKNSLNFDEFSSNRTKQLPHKHSLKLPKISNKKHFSTKNKKKSYDEQTQKSNKKQKQSIRNKTPSLLPQQRSLQIQNDQLDQYRRKLISNKISHKVPKTCINQYDEKSPNIYLNNHKMSLKNQPIHTNNPQLDHSQTPNYQHQNNIHPYQNYHSRQKQPLSKIQIAQINQKSKSQLIKQTSNYNKQQQQFQQSMNYFKNQPNLHPQSIKTQNHQFHPNNQPKSHIIKSQMNHLEQDIWRNPNTRQNLQNSQRYRQNIVSNRQFHNLKDPLYNYSNPERNQQPYSDRNNNYNPPYKYHYEDYNNKYNNQNNPQLSQKRNGKRLYFPHLQASAPPKNHNVNINGVDSNNYKRYPNNNNYYHAQPSRNDNDSQRIYNNQIDNDYNISYNNRRNDIGTLNNVSNNPHNLQHIQNTQTDEHQQKQQQHQYFQQPNKKLQQQYHTKFQPTHLQPPHLQPPHIQPYQPQNISYLKPTYSNENYYPQQTQQSYPTNIDQLNTTNKNIQPYQYQFQRSSRTQKIPNKYQTNISKQNQHPLSQRSFVQELSPQRQPYLQPSFSNQPHPQQQQKKKIIRRIPPSHPPPSPRHDSYQHKQKTQQKQQQYPNQSYQQQPQQPYQPYQQQPRQQLQPYQLQPYQQQHLSEQQPYQQQQRQPYEQQQPYQQQQRQQKQPQQSHQKQQLQKPQQQQQQQTYQQQPYQQQQPPYQQQQPPYQQQQHRQSYKQQQQQPFKQQSYQQQQYKRQQQQQQHQPPQQQPYQLQSHKQQTNKQENPKKQPQRQQQQSQHPYNQKQQHQQPSYQQQQQQKTPPKELSPSLSHTQSQKKISPNNLSNSRASNSSSHGKKQIQMRPTQLPLNQLFNFIQVQPISEQSRKQFQISSWKFNLSNKHSYLTRFFLNSQLTAFGIVTPRKDGDYHILYWGIISNDKIGLFLLKKYLQYLQKFTSLTNIYINSTQYSSLGFQQHNNTTSIHKRISPTKKQQNLQQFLSISCSNICFKQPTIQKYQIFYSEQIQPFKIQSTQISSNLALVQCQDISKLPKSIQIFSNANSMSQINQILQNNQIDSYAISDQINTGPCKLIIFKETLTIFYDQFYVRNGYFMTKGNQIYQNSNNSALVYRLKMASQGIYIYFGKSFKTIQDFLKQCIPTKEGQQKNFAFKMFSKQLYGRIKNPQYIKNNCYGNWDITFIWQDQLKGLIIKDLPSQKYLFGLDTFYVAIYYHSKFILAFQINNNDLIL